MDEEKYPMPECRQLSLTPDALGKFLLEGLVLTLETKAWAAVARLLHCTHAPFGNFQ